MRKQAGVHKKIRNGGINDARRSDIASQTLNGYTSGGGYLRQEPYKGDIFDAFARAYRNGYFEEGSSLSLRETLSGNG
jgi:hypothetical protein